jgi:hypothetical protein
MVIGWCLVKKVGLSQEVLDLFAKENQLKIPMSSLIRSFNIANSVAFVIGEARGKLTAIVLVSIDILAQIGGILLFFL